MKNNFAVFILTHGRANNVKTLKALEDSNYTGKTYLICDDEDEQIEDYKKLDKEVIVFNKEKVMKETDTIDNFKKHNAVVYARNETFNIAKSLNITHFLVLDDDYSEICFRYKDDGHLRAKRLTNADKLFKSMCDFLDVSNALTVCMSQAGDFIGGAQNGKLDEEIGRKAMNSFFCRTDRPFKFLGSTNEDVNAYTYLGNKGKLFFTIYKPSIVQTQTQSNPGGLTDIYLEQGTYIKSLYTVICSPNCAKVSVLNTKNPRIHHRINWNYCCPKIINEEFKK